MFLFHAISSQKLNPKQTCGNEADGTSKLERGEIEPGHRYRSGVERSAGTSALQHQTC